MSYWRLLSATEKGGRSASKDIERLWMARKRELAEGRCAFNGGGVDGSRPCSETGVSGTAQPFLKPIPDLCERSTLIRERPRGALKEKAVSNQ